VGPRAGVEAVEKKKEISHRSCQESNFGRPA
jgi:hypothetical protein